MTPLAELPEALGSAGGSARSSFLERALLAWIPERRWFRSKSRRPVTAALTAWTAVDDGAEAPVFTVVKVGFAGGEEGPAPPELYALPLMLVPEATARDLPAGAVIGPLEEAAGAPVLCDASWDPRFRAALFALLAGNRADTGEAPGSKILAAEQSNTSFAYTFGDERGGCFVKLYRRLEAAVNPEPEMLRFLHEHTNYRHVPAFRSSLEWIAAEGQPPVTLALTQALVAARGDAWEYTLENLRARFAEARASLPENFIAWINLLGRRVAELHNALASRPDVEGFAPEPLTSADLEHVRSGTRELLRSAFAALAAWPGDGNPDNTILAGKVLAGRARLEALLQTPARPEDDAPAGAVKIRAHGDLHLGQILVGAEDPADLWILDFEGEPGRPLAEARRKQSPLRDAAGMSRSFHYAAHTVLREAARPAEADALAEVLQAAFWDGYAGALDPGGPGAGPANFPRLRNLFMLEKAVYELHYELNNRPGWAAIPLRGLAVLCGNAD